MRAAAGPSLIPTYFVSNNNKLRIFMQMSDLTSGRTPHASTSEKDIQRSCNIFIPIESGSRLQIQMHKSFPLSIQNAEVDGRFTLTSLLPAGPFVS